MCLVKYEDYEEIFFLPPDVGVGVLVCMWIRDGRRQRKSKRTELEIQIRWTKEGNKNE